jgi:hypothetical protein
MRKVLSVLSVLLIGAGLAQAKDIEAGKIEVSGMSGGSLLMLSIEPEDGGSMDLSLIQAMVAGYYYVMPNIGAGGVLTYLNADIEDGDLTASLVMVGPSAKLSVNLSDPLCAFVSAAAGYAKATVEAGGGNEQDVDGFFGQAAGGVQFFLNDAVALNAAVTYQMIKLTVDDDDLDISGFAFNAGLSVFLP